ncbi:MAG: DUF4430 domain-containing protein [Clostridiales bacterium]|nr:DUF4430 domain-containing protein [Clostridiales bacterium]HOA85381.1 DUF4430 domain-containing protein [Bacillota bacterium]
MKKNHVFCSLAAVLCLFLLLGMVACGKKETPSDLWENAIYTEDTTLGSGAVTIVLRVEAGEKSIDLAIKTDKTTLADALAEHNLVGGEQSTYGLMIKYVNGIRADFDLDGAYWALYKNGEYATTGADSTVIADGEQYALVYEKG